MGRRPRKKTKNVAQQVRANAARLAKLRENAIAPLLIAGLLAVCSGLVWLWEHGQRELELRWPTTVATVVSQKLVHIGKHDDTSIVVRYIMHNRAYEATLLWDNNDRDEASHAVVMSASAPPVGSQLAAHYDPNNPAKSALDHLPRSYGSVPFVYAGTSGLFLVWGAFAWMRWRFADVRLRKSHAQ